MRRLAPRALLNNKIQYTNFHIRNSYHHVVCKRRLAPRAKPRGGLVLNIGVSERFEYLYSDIPRNERV